MNYLIILQKALKSVVKTVLKEVLEEGLHGETHFYITFKTDFPGVVLPKKLHEEYPFKMTIVLQHEFWNLEVFDTFFKVELIFDGKLEKIQVPFNSIYRFEDPSGPFALDLMVDQGVSIREIPEEEKMQQNNLDNVINLDAFRKKTEDTDNE